MTAGPTSLLGGRYALGDLLGRGGMADVHRAHDEVLDRPVAVKLFRAPLGDGTDDGRGPLSELVRAECHTLARLNHPGLVSVFDAGLQAETPGGEGRSYLVMELVDGPTLAQCCVDGSLGADRVAAIGADIADALAYVHAQGVVHRDVKPANVIVSSGGAPKLTDFGIARLVDSARHTQTGLTVGTAHYLSPEQVRGQDVGPPTDVYGLGLVLLECLKGEREYDGQPVEAALARLTRPPRLPETLPPGWAPLLVGMTALSPEERPSAREVAQRLRGLAVGEPLAAAPDATRVLTAPVPGAGAVTAAVPGPARGPTVSPRGARALGTGALPARPQQGPPRRRPVPDRLVAVLVAALVLTVLLVVLAVRSVGGSATPAPVPSPAGQLERDLAELRDSVQP